ncbi:TraR/DksA C4-type zinc finger protein [Pseudomonas sp. 18175]|uniref:TraR/DksA C4-type zinc finger protein n=1 Tax=Pseudomonas sp. 18175 TaxID=3390056 RepID=UPI003D1ABFC8
MDVAEHATAQDDDEPAARAYTQGLQRRPGRSAQRCEACGDSIPEDRRHYEPGTEHCFDCTGALKHMNRRGFR